MKVWIIKSVYLNVDQYSFTAVQPELDGLKYAVGVVESVLDPEFMARTLLGVVEPEELQSTLRDAYEGV